MSDTLTVGTDVLTRFSWDYPTRDPKLRDLYERSKAAQWNAKTDIDWSPPVEFGAPLDGSTDLNGLQVRRPDSCPVPPELWNAYRWEYHSWMTSQFLHGEQGALLAASRLVETTPDLDDKLCAALQVTDEARHVEAFSLYVQRLGSSYPINPALQSMLTSVLSDRRWDIIYLGMQVIIEGLALATFRLGRTIALDPIIRQIMRLVARDEARHVAFGMLALTGYYDGLTHAERAEREEFIKEAALLMSRRFGLDEIWDRMDIPASAGVEYALTDPQLVEFRRLMFSKIMANLARLGLVTDSVRAHFRELALIRPAEASGPA